MAHLIAAHVVEILMKIIPVIKLFPTAHHDSIVLDVNMYNDAGILRTFPIFVRLRRCNRLCKHFRVVLTGTVRARALEMVPPLVVMQWRLVATPV